MSHLDDRARYIVAFCVAHGVRTGEARALKRADIDLERDTVTIRRTFSGKHLRPCTKGKQERTLPLDPEWRDMYLNHGRELPNAWVFVGRHGKPHGHSYVLRHWTEACEKAGLTPCTFHQGTRHSKLTQLALAGVPTKFLQQLAGHEDERTTAKYTHMNDVEALRRVIQQAGKPLNMRIASNLPVEGKSAF